MFVTVIIYCYVLKVGSCSCLGVLSLRDNSLWQLPTELGNLRRLHVLDLSGNRFDVRFLTFRLLHVSCKPQTFVCFFFLYVFNIFA